MGACGSTNPAGNVACTESNEGKTAKERKEAWKRIRQEIPLEKTEEAKQRRIELFQKFDVNNTGRLSYAEVYDGCCRELKMEEFTTHLPEITRRAFNKAKDLGTKVKGSGSEDFVEFLEFRLMLCYLYNNFELTVMFDEIDKSGNMLIDEKEFKNAVPKLKEWGVDIVDPEAMFKELDKNSSGSVAFDEFAAWASGQKLELSGDPDNVQDAAPESAPGGTEGDAVPENKDPQDVENTVEKDAVQ